MGKCVLDASMIQVKSVSPLARKNKSSILSISTGQTGSTGSTGQPIVVTKWFEITFSLKVKPKMNKQYIKEE
jgi:hypothetical protein